MFCKKCGQQLPEGSKFCPNCGEDNSTVQQEQQQQQDNVFTGTVNNQGQSGITNRNIGICILLSVITCGIYTYVWLYQLAEDLKKATGDANATSGGMVVLLSIVTCGIYLWYWLYKAGEQVNAAKTTRGVATDSNLSIIYLVLGIFGFSLISLCLIQNELNKMTA